MPDRVRWPALLVLLAVLAFPGAASATIAPTLTLAPSSLPAGATHALGIDLAFAPSLGDSPTTFTLALPAGLLIDASLANGTCVTAATPIAGCELATGTVTTTFLTPELVSLWLVKGPSPLDLAGAALVAGESPSGQLQTTADVTLRTTPDTGLNLSFATLPGGLDALNELSFTLTGVRAPTSCPSPPATVGVSAISSEDASARTATAPLSITGCTSLAYAPKLAATVDRDTGDSGAAFSATVISSATGSATKAFSFDAPASLSPDANAALACLIGTPCTIGTASASSPLLPSSALSHGIVNLGGSVLDPTLTIGFPLPYPVSVTGMVDPTTDALTFSHLPDLPLTSLTVEVGGGSNVRLFTTTCATGSLTAKLTPWSGAPQQTASTPIMFGGSCPSTPSTPTAPSRLPTVTGASLGGLVRRAPKLSFTVNKGAGARAIKRIALALPKGLTLSGDNKSLAESIAVAGTHTKKFAVRVIRGVITITLTAASAKAAVTLGTPALTVSAALSKRVKAQLPAKKVTRLRFPFTLTDSARHATKLSVKLKPKS